MPEVGAVVVAIVFMFALALVMFVLGCMDQRKLYWKMAAWRYRNPEANKPSDSALAVSRGSHIFGAVLLAIFAFVFIGLRDDQAYTRSEVLSAVRSAASELENGKSEFAPMSSEVRQALDEAASPDALTMTEADSDEDGDRYEITNSDGDHPVCLTVDAEPHLRLDENEPWSTAVTATVAEGRC